MDPHSHFSHKRHHQQPPPPSTPSSQPPKPPPETLFRILCPAEKIGGIIGKGGDVIRHLRDSTGARIRILDDLPPFSRCDERVILIAADFTNPNPNPNPNGSFDEVNEELSLSVAQVALVKVFERILKVDEERSERNESDMNVDDERGNDNGNGDRNGGGGSVMCRLLVQGNQVGCVLGRGGKIIEKIRQESGAHVRVLPRQHIPACASPGDELIQMTGNLQSVKKALLCVSSCLQEHPSQNDTFPLRGEHSADHHTRSFMTGAASEGIGHSHRMFPEEDVVFRLLCPADKIGSLIGKGGSVVRAIENETGASIKIGDFVAPESDERIVVISACESLDMQRSPAQDAVIRVHRRIAEIGFEPGAAVIVRLLVPSQQIGCLLGKGGSIIAEMRRVTGANIRIFGKDVKLTPNDELVQVTGSSQLVQDALFQITSRLREFLFPSKPRSHISSSSYFSTYQDLPSPSFRPGHDKVSPGHFQSSVGLSNAYDNRNTCQTQAHSSFSHNMDRSDGSNVEHDHHHYGGDKAFYSMSLERPPSPKVWHSQEAEYGNPSRYSDGGSRPSSMVSNNSESSQMPMVISVEVVVPQILLPHVYGENQTNLGHITKFSGADVIVHGPKPGATEGRVVISGTPSQLHTAQSLVQAFILCGQAF